MNNKAKRKKLSKPPYIVNAEVESVEGEQEIDETISEALKTFLKRENNNWEDICNKWEKTFKYRQRDLKLKEKSEFLLEWPKFKHSKAPELVTI